MDEVTIFTGFALTILGVVFCFLLFVSTEPPLNETIVYKSQDRVSFACPEGGKGS